MKNTFFGIIAISILAVSCKKDERPTYLTEEAGVQQPVAMNQAAKPSLLDQSGIKTTSGSGMSTVTAAGMNPPHGQPGHRCDIPVGQPLNSAPPQAGTQNVNVTPNGQTMQIAPASVQNGNAKAVTTAPGMNPPHGQPGHRCEIPVGQPLNSKPAPASQPAKAIAQNTPAAVPSPTPTGPKPANNPPHGEAWHNCAVKVGEPLP